MAAGDEIIAKCGACKLDLRHVVIAHKSGNSGPIAKVQCKTCGAIHGYRAAKGATERKVGSGTPRARKPKVEAVPVSVVWQEKLRELQGKSAKAYTPQTVFDTGDVLEHPKFGIGVVEEIKGPKKCQVLFQDEVRILVHNL